VEAAVVVVVAVALAALTWWRIELPVRHRKVGGRRAVFALSAAAAGVCLIVAAVTHVARGFPGRAPEAVVRLAAAARRPPHPPCFNPRPTVPLATQVCAIGTDGPPPSFLLWGDSHALTLRPGVDAAARRAGVAGLFLGRAACPPLLGVEPKNREGRECAAFNARVAAWLVLRREVRRVVLVGRWALHSQGTRYGHERGGPAGLELDGVTGPAAFRLGLLRTVAELVVTQIPEIGWEVPSVLARAQWFGRAAPPGPMLAAYRTRQQAVTEALAALAGRAIVVDVGAALCRDNRCAVAEDGQALYADTHHLSAAGAIALAPALAGAFAD
jgi:hypothetical protein